MIRNGKFPRQLRRHSRMEAKYRAYLLAPRERWTPGHKYDVCVALTEGEKGFITTAELVRAHGLAEDEIAQWLVDFGRGGMAALKQQRRAA